jgi:hypothetical protein
VNLRQPDCAQDNDHIVAVVGLDYVHVPPGTSGKLGCQMKIQILVVDLIFVQSFLRKPANYLLTRLLDLSGTIAFFSCSSCKTQRLGHGLRIIIRICQRPSDERSLGFSGISRISNLKTTVILVAQEDARGSGIGRRPSVEVVGLRLTNAHKLIKPDLREHEESLLE